MTTNTTNKHIGTSSTATGLGPFRRGIVMAAVAGVTALTATVLTTAPIQAAAPAGHQAPAAEADNGAILKDTRLTLVNNTDMSFRYTPAGSSTTQTIKPGQSVVDQGDGSLIGLTHGKTSVTAWAFNHGIGTPEARGLIKVGNDERQRTEHQGENEHDVLVENHGLTLSSYRHADTKTKNFTITLDKTSAAQLTLDNTASASNAYVHIGGKMTPVKKHTAAQLPALTRGKNTTIEVDHGSRPTTVQVTWSGPIATFHRPGHQAVALANGEHTTIGSITISRADTNHDAGTAYTLTTR